MDKNIVEIEQEGFNGIITKISILKETSNFKDYFTLKTDNGSKISIRDNVSEKVLLNICPEISKKLSIIENIKTELLAVLEEVYKDNIELKSTAPFPLRSLIDKVKEL